MVQASERGTLQKSNRIAARVVQAYVHGSTRGVGRQVRQGRHPNTESLLPTSVKAKSDC